MIRLETKIVNGWETLARSYDVAYSQCRERYTPRTADGGAAQLQVLVETREVSSLLPGPVAVAMLRERLASGWSEAVPGACPACDGTGESVVEGPCWLCAGVGVI